MPAAGPEECRAGQGGQKEPGASGPGTAPATESARRGGGGPEGPPLAYRSVCAPYDVTPQGGVLIFDNELPEVPTITLLPLAPSVVPSFGPVGVDELPLL